MVREGNKEPTGDAGGNWKYERSLSGVVIQKNQFRKETSTLVRQVSDSLLTSDGPRIRHGEPSDDQQLQMNELMSRTQ